MANVKAEIKEERPSPSMPAKVEMGTAGKANGQAGGVVLKPRPAPRLF
jgi:hypothetical protein